MIYLVIGGICLVVLIIGIAYLLQGPPYVQLRDKPAEDMLKLISHHNPQRILEMGSGDGKLAILLAQQGYQVDGIELNPWLVYKSRQAVKKARLDKKVTIRWGDFWKLDVSQYDMVTIYLTQHIMPRLEMKLVQELKPGSLVVSHYFTFPHIKPIRKIGDAKLYEID